MEDFEPYNKREDERFAGLMLGVVICLSVVSVSAAFIIAVLLNAFCP